MKHIITPLVVIGFLLSPLTSLADAFVWQAKKNKQTLYLGGTIHALRSIDYPLPKEFEKAYLNADLLVFETDTRKMVSLEGQQKMMALAIASPEESLSKVLTPQTYTSLKQYASTRGIPIAQLDTMKTGFVMMMLMLAELQRFGINPMKGVEHHFMAKAQTDSKNILELESVDFGLQMIANMGKGYEDKFVSVSLNDLAQLQTEMEKLIAAWKKGDEEVIDKEMAEKMRKELPKLYQTLLINRNKRWAEKIDSYIKTPQKEFILVGAAHLIGKQSLIQLLKKKGYKIEKLKLKQ